MASKLWYGLVALGSLITFGALLVTLLTMGSVLRAIIGGVVALGGVFLIIAGLTRTSGGRQSAEAVDSEEAQSTTGYEFRQ